MTEKRYTYITRIITDRKGYCKDYILDNETLLNTEQIVTILNIQNDYIDYVTKERNLAYSKLKELEKENEKLKTELNDCTVILYSVFGEMNYLNHKTDPVILKKYKELFDDE